MSNNLPIMSVDNFEIGQKIIYENEEANIIHVKPLFVIKTRNRAICGSLQNQIETLDELNN